MVLLQETGASIFDHPLLQEAEDEMADRSGGGDGEIILVEESRAHAPARQRYSWRRSSMDSGRTVLRAELTATAPSYYTSYDAE